MVQKRESIIKVAMALCDLMKEGGTVTIAHMDYVKRLEALCAGGGTYRKKYSSHESRVLHRHLNLYKNKLKSAKTVDEKRRWARKVEDQEGLIAKEAAQMAGGRVGLDLDGL